MSGDRDRRVRRSGHRGVAWSAGRTTGVLTLVSALLLVPAIGVIGAPEPGPFPTLPAPAQSAAAQEEEQERDGCEEILEVE